MVWDTATGERLHTLRDKSDNMMALQDLAIDPEASTESEIVLFSSSSDPFIRRWRITLDSASQILDTTNGTKDKPASTHILEHETSIYKIMFSGDDEDTDLWTASADGTAKCLSRSRNWQKEDSYEHKDYVRAVVVSTDWVVTAGRDENVKVWDRATGKVHHVYEGHFEEVTGLVLLEGEQRVVSVSIDGTVRTWSLGKNDLQNAIKEADEKAKGEVKVEKPKSKKSLMTAEEEAELAELMGSDEE